MPHSGERMTPEEYCQRKAAGSGSSFYYSFLFLPPERRRAITALYAFCREVDDVVDECADPQLARTKLAWWRSELAATYAGRPSHPVTQSLAEAVRAFSLPQELLAEIIDGMEMDLAQTRYADFKALHLYCYRVASVVGLLAAEIFGYQDRHTLKYAHDLGLAFQLTNIIRDVGEDARRGRIYLPQDEMARFGVTEAHIAESRVDEAWQQLMQFQVQRARDMMKSGAPLGSILSGRIGLEMRLIIAGGNRILAKLESVQFDMFRRRPVLRPFDWVIMLAKSAPFHL